MENLVSQKEDLNSDLANKNKQLSLFQSKLESNELKLNKKIQSNEKLKSELESIKDKYKQN